MLLANILVILFFTVTRGTTSDCFNKIPDKLGAWMCADDWLLEDTADNENGYVQKSVYFQLPNDHSVDRIRMTACNSIHTMRISTLADVTGEKLPDIKSLAIDWVPWDIKTSRAVSSTLHEYEGFLRQASFWKLDMTLKKDVRDRSQQCSTKYMFHARAGIMALWTSDGYKADFGVDSSRGRQKRAITEAPLTNRCRKVAKIPRGMANRHRLNTQFYFKYTSAYGIPVMSSKFVNNRALQRACYVLRVLLAERKDMRDHLYTNKGRLTVMATNQTIPMVPELKAYSHWTGRAVSGTLENPVTVIHEEHLLCHNDRYSATQDILVHELAHAVHAIASRTALSTLDFWISESYEKAKRKGLWNNTYAVTNHLEYFAEGVQSYFNHQREGSVGGDGIQNEINTNKELKRYDATLHRLIKGVFPCRNRIIPRCEDLSQKKGLKQKVRMDCKYENVAPPVPGTCKDDRWFCRYWSRNGECTNNPRFMVQHCRRSCKVCTPSPTKTTQTSLKQDYTTGSVIAVTIPTAITESNQCDDKHENCRTWKSYCKTLPHIRVACRSTCGSCGVETRVASTTVQPYTENVRQLNCSDRHILCPKWESYCSSLTHIRDMCPRTCKVCVNTAIPTTSSLATSNSRSTTGKPSRRCKDKGRNCLKLRSRCAKPSIKKRCPVTCNVCTRLVAVPHTITPATHTQTTNSVHSGARLVCVDRKGNCQSWINSCSKPYARKNCRLTCKLCSNQNDSAEHVHNNGRNKTDCVDNNKHCSIWISSCSNNRYVAKHCRKTCGFCNSGNGNKITPQMNRTTEAPQTDACACKDTDAACSKWTAHCASNRYVSTHCKRTCNFCGRAGERNCRRT